MTRLVETVTRVAGHRHLAIGQEGQIGRAFTLCLGNSSWTFASWEKTPDHPKGLTVEQMRALPTCPRCAAIAKPEGIADSDLPPGWGPEPKSLDKALTVLQSIVPPGYHPARPEPEPLVVDEETKARYLTKFEGHSGAEPDHYDEAVEPEPEEYHVILAAFSVLGRSPEEAQRRLIENLPQHRNGTWWRDTGDGEVATLQEWWIAEDDRFDGSNNNSAVFVPKSLSQGGAWAILEGVGDVEAIVERWQRAETGRFAVLGTSLVDEAPDFGAGTMSIWGDPPPFMNVDRLDVSPMMQAVAEMGAPKEFWRHVNDDPVEAAARAVLKSMKREADERWYTSRLVRVGAACAAASAFVTSLGWSVLG